VAATSLNSAPRTAAAAVPGAAAVLPTPEDPPVPTGAWALCDTPGPDGRPTSTMIANAGPSAPLGPAGGLLLKAPDGQIYLVIDRTKYRVDAPEARQAYDLRDHVPRPVSAALLAAIPDGQPLGAPSVPGAGQDSAALPGHAVGDVVRVPAPGQPDRHYLVLAAGVQDISAPVAALVRATVRADVSQPPDSVPLEQVNAAPRVVLAELARYPAVLPRIVDPPDAGTVCWQWPANGVGGTVTTAAAPPVPPRRPVTQLAQAGRQGALDAVSLPAGGALVACAVSTTQPACPAPSDRATERTASSGGPLWLVSETGVGYPIANAETAAALGVTSAVPAPADALRMLPTGPTLDASQAQRTVDVLVSAPAG
jgi:type VII secretion protein EccB